MLLAGGLRNFSRSLSPRPIVAAGGGGFDFASIGTLVKRHSALAITGLANGDDVTSWADSNGGAAATGPSTPAFYRTNWNGVPAAVEFTSGGSALLGTVSVTGTTLTAIALCRMSGLSVAYARILSMAPSALAFDYDTAGGASLLREVETANVGGYRNGAFSWMTLGYNTWGVLAGRYDGSDFTPFLNGVAGSSVGSAGTFGITHYRLGNQTASGAQLDGAICDVLIYSTPVSDANIAAASAELLDLYAL